MVSSEQRWRGPRGKEALRSLTVDAGLWANAYVRSNVVSGAPRVMAGTASTRKALRIVNCRLMPVWL